MNTAFNVRSLTNYRGKILINKHCFFAVVICVLAVFPIVSAADMSDELNQFKIENRTGTVIDYIFVSVGDSVNYGADILSAAGPLRDGQEIQLFVHYPDRCELFNFMAIAENADYFSVFHFEICDGKQSQLRLGRNYFAGTKMADANTVVVIENGTSHAFRHLFLAPGDTETWGIDYLGGNIPLGPGRPARLRLRTPAEDMTYAVRALDDKGQTYSFAIDVNDSMSEFVYEIVDDWIDVQSE